MRAASGVIPPSHSWLVLCTKHGQLGFLLTSPSPGQLPAWPITELFGVCKGGNDAAQQKTPYFLKEGEVWICHLGVGRGQFPGTCWFIRAVRLSPASCFWQHQGPAAEEWGRGSSSFSLSSFKSIPPLCFSPSTMQIQFREQKEKSRFPLLGHNLFNSPEPLLGFRW